jgi:hypothetical protein
MSDPASIPVAPIVEVIAPYAVALVLAGIGWGLTEFKKLTGVQVSQADIAKLDAFAKAEAGALIAASTTNLAGESIKVGSPIIAAAATRVIDALPGILDKTGFSPDAVETIIAGHLGAMQASAAQAVVAPDKAA